MSQTLDQDETDNTDIDEDAETDIEGDDTDPLQASVAQDYDAEEAAEARLGAEPPSAGELAVDVTGLQPQRARLVRFAAWLGRTRAELKTLEDGRASFLEAMGVPAVTEARLRALVEADAHGFLTWMRSGSPKVTFKQARSFERKKLEEKLAGDRHTAEVSRKALDQIERDIDAKRAEVAVLGGRHEAFVHDAAIEHAEDLGEKYAMQLAEMRETVAALMGLATIAGSRRGFRSAYVESKADVQLPIFGLACFPGSRPDDHPVTRAKAVIARIVVTGADAKAAAAPWRKLVDAWTTDPRAEVTAP